jgi:hypothetical protein
MNASVKWLNRYAVIAASYFIERKNGSEKHPPRVKPAHSWRVKMAEVGSALSLTVH